jgi:lysophospholipid hydrolase
MSSFEDAEAVAAAVIDEESSFYVRWSIWLLRNLVYYTLRLSFLGIKVPLTVISYTTLQLTVTFQTWQLLLIFVVIFIGLYILFRYRLLNPYARLPKLSESTGAPFDLHPDTTEDKSLQNGYPDDFMGVFLSSIKVFGYMDKKVFHELARYFILAQS